MMNNMNNTKTGTYFYNDEYFAFNFATNLPTSDKVIFVRTVVDTIVDNYNYDFVLRDIIFDYTIISMMTDIDTSFLKIVDDNGNMITDIDLLEDFLLETNIIEIIEANAFPTLFRELNGAVDKSIEYRTGIHHNPLNDALASLISTLEKKVNEVDLESMMGMAQKFAGMGDDFTMENLVKAYMESDIHKKNLADIEETKRQRAEFAEDMDKAINSVVGK